MSADNFDPYFKWLGIAPKDQPPTYYRLLGIDPFTEDLDVISNAADRQMMLIRTFQTGQHSGVSQRLLNEVSTARTCLLDARSKQEYDRALRARIGSPQAAPGVREPNIATQPPLPAQTPPIGQSGSAGQPLTVPMAAPAASGAAPNAMHSPPVLPPGSTDLTPNPLGAIPAAPASYEKPLPSPTLKKRRRDQSQLWFWVVGAGVGAVLLLLLVLIVGRFTSAPETEQEGGAAAKPSDAEAKPDVTEVAGNPVEWRAVGKREWLFSGEDVSAEKEMQPGSWLMSRGDYGDFVITLEYLLEQGGAGGVYVRVPSEATWPWNQGLEIHFTDDAPTSDRDHESTGSIWHRTPPNEIASRPTGQWNDVRIECKGRDITVTINNEVVTRYRIDQSMPTRGHIGLDGVSGGITYRNLRVEDLD